LRLLSRRHGTLGAAACLALAAALLAWPGATAGVSAAPKSADAVHAVVAAARSHVGARYRFGGTGPAFDCSGLVYRVFKDTHQLQHVGGKRMTATALLHWFTVRGRTDAKFGVPGDLVVYGQGAHVGIYIGHGKVISALTRGVRRHGLRSMTIRFSVFLHTRLSDVAPVLPATD